MTMTLPIKELSDGEIEEIYEQAHVAAIHATSSNGYANPYPPTTTTAVLFDGFFRSHYARENGK